MAETMHLIAGSDSYEIALHLSSDGFGMPPVRHITQAGPLQHGATLLDTRLEPRTVDVAFWVPGGTRQGYWDARAAVMEYLKRFDDLVLRKTLPDDSQRDLSVVYAGGATLPNPSMSPTDLLVAVRLMAYDPIWRASAPSSLVVGMPAYPDAGQLPWVFPVMFGAASIAQDITLTYAGTWRAYPQIDIRGPLTNPTISNLTTGEDLALTAEIDDGDVVRIDLAPLVKTVWHITDDVSWLPYLSSDSDLATWHLAASPEAVGGTNALRLTGLSAGTATAITLRWRDCYVGV